MTHANGNGNAHAPDNDKKRLLRVTEGNIRNHHVYVKGHYDFFPADCFGGPKRSERTGTIDIQLAGLRETVSTDIGRHSKTGKPRGLFRQRSLD
jgi:hypothetical protein